MWESLWTGDSSPEGGGWLLLVRIEIIHDQSNWELQASLACGCRWGYVSLLVLPRTQELSPSSRPVAVNPEGLPEGPPRHTSVASLLRHTTPATPTWEGPVSAGWSYPLLGSGAIRIRAILRPAVEWPGDRTIPPFHDSSHLLGSQIALLEPRVSVSPNAIPSFSQWNLMVLNTIRPSTPFFWQIFYKAPFIITKRN